MDQNNYKAVSYDGEMIQFWGLGSEMQSGDRLENVRIKKNFAGNWYVADDINHYSCRSQSPIAAEQDKAPEVFCRYWFAGKLFNGQGDALSDYSIKRITVLDGGNEHMIRFRVVYTVTPARYATKFSWYRLYEDKKFGSMEPSKELTADVTLVGTDGLWMPVKETISEINNWNTPHEVYPDYLYVAPLINVHFQSDKYTYYSEYRVAVDKDGTNQESTTLTTVYAYRNSDQKVTPVIKDIENMELEFLDKAGDKIIFSSTWHHPEGEPGSGPIYVMDESTLKVKEIPCVCIYTVSDQGIYYGERYNDEYYSQLCYYDYASDKITKLPGACKSLSDYPVINESTPFCSYEGKLIWFVGDKWLCVGPDSDMVSEYVWK
ncbi:MAG TPA: hypothetical protein PLV03_00360 [Clostridiales bacterium]|nr:hypothetical protein [Clostridiales bacterium]